MNSISLKKVIPNVFSNLKDLHSGVWNKNISFEKGKSYLIEAVSGKGKSSLCSYLFGYRGDYSGDIYFNSKNIRSFRPMVWDKIHTDGLSMMFQDLLLFPELTAIENVLIKNNLTSYKKDYQISEMFDRLMIGDKMNQKIGKMSWGQQQRVALIRCFCQPFHFIVLDEPISHLDDENASIMAGMVQEEVSQQGAGVIVTSIGKHLPLEYTEILAL